MRDNRNDRRGFLRGLAGAGLGCTLAGAAGAPLTCRVVDRQSGAPVAARVRLVDAQGREVVPVGHPDSLSESAQEGDVRFQSRRFAYVDGAFEVDPRLLPLRYQVIKGYEYLIAEGEIPAAGGAVTIPVSRWSSLGADGWYSGDIHIHHIAPKTCRLEMDAEDLNVANILTSDFTADQEQFEGRVNQHSSGKRLVYVSQEFRHDDLGHLCVLNLKKLLEPVKPMQRNHYPLHLGVCDRAHQQGAYVSWAHFPSWPGLENPLDVAMDKLDGLEIMCQLDPRHFPIFVRDVVPELAANDGLRLWYRYLNCGYRLTATAGTDKMTNFVTVGANRVFAQVEGEFSYQGWIDALKQGRTFVTNSPLLRFTVNGRPPGATLRLDSRRDKVLAIEASAESQLPYDRLEIVVNGRVVAEAAPGRPRHRPVIRLEHAVTESCWIAARVTEDMGRYRSRGVDFTKIHPEAGTPVSDHYGTRRAETAFAHSSPVYAIRDGAPIRSEADAEYYVRYLENVIGWLERRARFASDADRRASIEAFQSGVALYRKRAEEARAKTA